MLTRFILKSECCVEAFKMVNLEEISKEGSNIFEKVSSCVSFPEGSITFISKRHAHILVKTKQSNFQRSMKLEALKSFHWKDNSIDESFPMESSSIIQRKVSPSGGFLAILRQTTGEDRNSSKLFVEIWGKNELIVSIDCSKKHGNFYQDVFFASLSWSRDENSIVYIAEQKADDHSSSAEENGASTINANKYTYRQDWGEGYSQKERPVIVVCRWREKSVTVLHSLSVSAGQVSFLPDGKRLVFHGLEEKGQWLGILHCCNRLGSVYTVALDGSDLRQLHMEKSRNARFPRISPNDRYIVYLTSGVNGPHKQCLELWKYNIDTRKETCIVNMVHHPENSTAFPGLYSDGIPFDDCWIEQDLTLSSTWRCRKVIVRIDIENGSIQQASDQDGDWNLLAAKENLILATKSFPNSPQELLLGTLDEKSVLPHWIRLSSERCDEFSKLSASVDYKISTMRDGLETIILSPSKSKTFLLKPTISSSTPLLCIPHGGPHSAHSVGYNPLYFAWCLLGFTVVLINYQGSTGYGQSYIDRLCGNIGTLDRDDCLFVVDEMKSKHENIVLFGGSHGGFLVAHLVAHRPNFFKACILGNPVIQVANNYVTSDIPDWSLVEAGVSSAQSALEAYELMYRVSPMSSAHQIITPMMFFLGKEDRRVPMQQSLLLHADLVKRNIPSEVFVYPEGHGFNKVEVEAHEFLNATRFFVQYMT